MDNNIKQSGRGCIHDTVGAGKQIPVIVSRASGGFYISETITAARSNKDKSYVAIADHINSFNTFKDYTTGTKYDTLAEASEYLRLRKEAAPKRAIATFLCVISPITLIMLAALSEVSSFGISENAAAGIGLCVLIVLVAVAVMLFMSCAAKERAYDFLESEPFETEYGVSGMVKERRKEIEDSRTRLNMIGTVLCILSVIPLFAALFINPTDIICARHSTTRPISAAV